MRGIGLIPNWQKENTALVVERICDFFEERNIQLLTADARQVDWQTSCSLAEGLEGWSGRVDMLIVVGGDGTILRAARDLAHWDVPILGINVGHKGFLAEIEVEQMDRYLQYITAGRYRDVYKRQILEWAQRCGRLLTVEENTLAGGFGSAVLELLAGRGLTLPVRRLGIEDRFVEQGPRELLLSIYGLDAAGIFREALSFAGAGALRGAP